MDLDINSCIGILKSCSAYKWIHQGRQLHLLLLKRGLLGYSVVTGNCLLQMYTRCGSLSDAYQLFKEMPQRNCFSWNTVIEGYMTSGLKEKSLELFDYMPHKNDYTWDLVVSGFARAGELGVAHKLFLEMPRKNGVVWNSIIHGYTRIGQPEVAIKMFKLLISNSVEWTCADTFVLATVFRACTDLNSLACGKQIHGHIVTGGMELDSVLGSSLINLYGKCGDLDSAHNVLNMMQVPDDFCLSALIAGYAKCGRIGDARRVFDLKRNECVIVWNSMVSGYIANGEAEEAFFLFKEMKRRGVAEDFCTVSSVLNACCTLGVLEIGKQMHSYAFKVRAERVIIIASALIDFYYKCGDPGSACKFFDELQAYDTILLNLMITVYSNCGRIQDASKIFETMQQKTLISWNSMIVGFSQNGYPLKALGLFREMNELGLSLDKFSLASVISSSGSISSIELGEQVFARAITLGLEFDQIISTSLVDFYCKCGFVEIGRKLFDASLDTDAVTWNSMLMGYAANGRGDKALELFDNMLRAGVHPTCITFTGVLSACDHCGLVDEGRKWFYRMKSEYHINPDVEHYSCIIDLFARSGCLEEAMDLIDQMPFSADASMWSSVLRGSVAHGYTTLGMKVARKILELDPENSGAYVQLSGIYATSEDWEGLEKIREVMKEKQIRKSPGFSRLETLKFVEA